MGKRIKTVFKKLDPVAKLWASQSQPRAEYSYYTCSCGSRFCGHNSKQCPKEKTRALYFDGAELYSYGSHYLMGKFLEFNGRKIAVLNRTKYSATTSSQFGVVSRAVEALGIPRAYIDGGDHRQKFNWRATDSDLVAAVREEIAAERARLKLRVENVENGCRDTWSVESTRDDLREFNARMEALREPSARFLIPDCVFERGAELARAHEIARENHAQRRQLELVLETPKTVAKTYGAVRVVIGEELCQEPSYRARRRDHRRTS